MRKKAGIYLLYAALLLIACSVNPGGSGTETTTSIAGSVVNTQGAPVSNASVRLLPSDFDPITDSAHTPILSTDSLGKYTFSGIQNGNYCLQVIDTTSRTSGIVGRISAAGKEICVPACTLQAPGSLKVALPQNPASAAGYVYIPGTTIAKPVTGTDTMVFLDSVPPGVIPEVSYSSDSNHSSVLRYDAVVSSGSTTTILNTLWKYSRRIVLNTGTTGADIPGTVLKFPVLIRLNSSVFNFKQCRASGADLRFARSDNQFLPFEIESWDSVAGTGEIWVGIDTILGNNSSQYIMMYWGNDSAAQLSNGPAVFDTGNGFVGVWHLADIPSGNNSIKDQTAHGYHGTPVGNFSTSNLVSGAIGKALRFNGVNNTICIGKQVPSGPGFTLEAWVFVNTLKNFQRFIYNQHGYTLWYDIDKIGVRMEYLDQSAVWRGIPQDGGAVQPITTGTWYHLASVYDGNKARLYINGTLATESGSIASVPNAATDSLLFGSFQHTHYVNGIMDEIRIESTPRSGDWLRLCYMNQKTNSPLVEFGQ